ncbi:MAG: HAMP domain-containing protein [Phycisphaerae bacterium]|nr:HAMP domain-containing protein [Phycisphaerae bacterium]
MHLDFRQKHCLVYTGVIAAVALLVMAFWRSQAYGVAVMAAVAAVMGWVVSGVSARRLRRSIGRLRQAAEAVGRGDFTQRVGYHADDDLAKLVHAFNAMADRLESMAAEDQQLRDQLRRSERLAAIGELAATVAHEVNNPLDGIQSCTRIIRRDVQDVSQIRRMLDLMDAGLYRIEMIVRRLLTFARDEAMNLVPTSMGDVVNDALLFVQPKLDKHRLTLVRPHDERPVFALADRTQVAQALINLLLNAVDSTAPGGQIVVDVAEPAEPGAMVHLIVQDDGAGIAPEHVEHIFEPFFSTKGAGSGTGLGLAVVRKIVEAHHGRIDVDSRLGEGTRFVVSLPAARAKADAGEPRGMAVPQAHAAGM